MINPSLEKVAFIRNYGSRFMKRFAKKPIKPAVKSRVAATPIRSQVTPIAAVRKQSGKAGGQVAAIPTQTINSTKELVNRKKKGFGRDIGLIGSGAALATIGIGSAGIKNNSQNQGYNSY